MIDQKKKINNYLQYLFCGILTIIVFSFYFRLWDADLTVPFAYQGDFVISSSLVKGMIENGWFFYNPNIGQPYGLNFLDYPTSDNLHFLLMKIISIFNSNYAVVINLYYILTFLLTALISLYVLKQFKIKFWVALVVSILFTNLPYHYLRLGHLFLSGYYMIPLIVMITVRSLQSPLLLTKVEDKYKLNLFNKTGITYFIICFLLASSGVYYSFFACMILSITGLILLLNRKIEDFKPKLISILFIGFYICLGLVVNLIPSFVNNIINGKNLTVASRNPIETEVYSMKITQLFMPIYNHGVSAIQKQIDLYAKFPLNNEGSEYLGLFGSIGFLILIVAFLVREQKNTILQHLSVINIITILISTIGGFGTLFALFISPQIRAYNRVSVFIAFFSLFALALVVDQLLKQRRNKTLITTSVIIIMLFGIFEQWSPFYSPQYNMIKADFKNDRDFVLQIENSLPKDSRIFQLPYMPFPENPPIHRLGDYELLKGYLHSTHLKWSYGSIKGRPGDIWHKELASTSLDKMLERLSFAEFNGIYIDRRGYEDGAASLIKQLSTLLAQQPIENKNKNQVFFSLIDFNKQWKSKFTKEEWEQKKISALNPLYTTWGEGFSTLEGNSQFNWRWSSSRGSIEYLNLSQDTKKIKIDMKIMTGYKEQSDMIVESNLFPKDSIKVTSEGVEYSKIINIPPGKSTISFTSNSKQILAPSDPRTLIFKIENYNMTEIVD